MDRLRDAAGLVGRDSRAERFGLGRWRDRRQSRRNSGFETPVTGIDWSLDQALYNKGLGGQSVYAVHSGHYSLRLAPNAQNVSGLGNAQFGLGQSLDASLYLGQTLYFSGWMAAYGGATAVLRLVAVSTTGAVWYRELRQAGNSATPAFQQDVLDID